MSQRKKNQELSKIFKMYNCRTGLKSYNSSSNFHNNTNRSITIKTTLPTFGNSGLIFTALLNASNADWYIFNLMKHSPIR